ncbi:hypothetical protein [Spirosoma oryzicola]|uniref:hypothetical protein n=1 Tax=Spirosoma oryzicola TaxID=2898794 RepID=UPI001E427A3D|nr:hypothetical protein [Spirosoma oryzicola]UHG94780.1 hypothetical protein LQ777_28990 [Spirosoma oryzicola]
MDSFQVINKSAQLAPSLTRIELLEDNTTPIFLPISVIECKPIAPGVKAERQALLS